MSLHAITRLDVSNNDLTDIPASVLQMQSLKQLNLSKNKLEQLPAPLMMPKNSLRRGSKNTSVENFGGGGVYNCPWLEEMQLQDKGAGGKHVRKYAPCRDALCSFVIKTDGEGTDGDGE